MSYNTITGNATANNTTLPIEMALVSTMQFVDCVKNAQGQYVGSLTGVPAGTYQPGSVIYRLKGSSPAVVAYNKEVVTVVDAPGGVVTPAAPANPAVDDTNNVYSVDVVSGYSLASQYDYSTNAGASYTNGAATGSALSIANSRVSLAVGNLNKPAGQVLIRVAATSTAPASAGTANPTGFTIATAPANGVNIVCHGNSVTFGPGGGPWPQAMQAMLGSGYTVINSGQNGQSLEGMISELDTKVFANYNASAAFNILFVQEQINSLRNGDGVSTYYDLLVKYSNLVAGKAGQSWVIVPITGTPTTITPGSTADINTTSQAITAAINAVQNSGTGSQQAKWTANHILNLQVNRRIGRFGTSDNGQDAGYSSYAGFAEYTAGTTPPASATYADGTHPNPNGNQIIAHLGYDMVSYIVNGTAIPDQSNYPDTAAQPGTPARFNPAANQSPYAVVNGNTITSADGGSFHCVQGVGADTFTKGNDGDDEYRGSLFFTQIGAHAGLIGVTDIGSPTEGAGWMNPGFLLNGDDMRVLKYGDTLVGIPAYSSVNGSHCEMKVFNAYTELWVDDRKVVRTIPVPFGLPMAYAVSSYGGFGNITILALP